MKYFNADASEDIELQYEYGRRFDHSNYYKWYTDKTERQVRAFIKAGNNWTGTRWHKDTGPSKLVRRLVSTEIEEVE